MNLRKKSIVVGIFSVLVLLGLSYYFKGITFALQIGISFLILFVCVGSLSRVVFGQGPHHAFFVMNKGHIYRVLVTEMTSSYFLKKPRLKMLLRACKAPHDECYVYINLVEPKEGEFGRVAQGDEVYWDNYNKRRKLFVLKSVRDNISYDCPVDISRWIPVAGV